MGLKGKVAGEILGPRPGLVIVSFWGGRIEIILRILAPLFGSLPALIAAAVALSTLRDIEGIDKITGDAGDLRDNTYAATGLVIAVTALAIIYEVLMIVLRFLNVGIINLKIKIFLIIDVVVSCVLAGGHFAGGVLQAFYGKEWDDSIYDDVDDAQTIKKSMIASAVFCFVAVVLFVILAIFMIIYMVKDWNSKVVKETVKDAVTG